MGEILIGTSGYSYKDWIGPFYPPGLPERRMLEFYSRRFPFAEVNATYYRLPAARTFEAMLRHVPPRFLFTVKAYRSLTHERESGSERDARLFREALAPLLEGGRLGAVLLQFPYSFKNQEEERAWLGRLRRWLADLPLVAEFRHEGWFQEATYAWLRELQVGFTCVDAPRLPGLPPPAAVVTSSTAYVRFHGRNAAKWWSHEAAYERYDYLYRAEELEEWLPRVRELAAGSGRLFVAFNNHYQGQAVVNARMLAGSSACRQARGQEGEPPR
ncbi:MAG: DUF72 domain-containing protein [Bacillota bacterium]|nr:DUF72 domain-containing protein [Bacillota bacterium]